MGRIARNVSHKKQSSTYPEERKWVENNANQDHCTVDRFSGLMKN